MEFIHIYIITLIFSRKTSEFTIIFNWLMKKPENLEVKDTYIVCCPIKFYIVFGFFFLFSFGISLFALYDYYKNSQIEVGIKDVKGTI